MELQGSKIYQETLDYLYTRLPMFSRIGSAAIKKDLTNTLALCEALGNPQRLLKCIHIAGTNGKGSTSHMLAAAFQTAGYKTGLYTSPHLQDFRERIRINGAPVPESFVVDFVNNNKAAIESIEPSFFEITVAMAFAAFAAEEVDIAIIETGLGGRLDSTNVIVPELSVITNISLDHTDMLGDSIEKIAAEKAGIIKYGIPVVGGTDEPDALAVFKQTAERLKSPFFISKRWSVRSRSGEDPSLGLFDAVSQLSGEALELSTDLVGSYQEENLATALTAIEVMQSLGWNIASSIATEAFRSVKEMTGLRGRWEILQQDPMIVADVAHNPAGLELVMAQWRRLPANAKHIVAGFVRDKDIRSALSLFPPDSVFHFCAANLPRALPANELAIIAAEMGLSGKVYDSVATAVTGARRMLSKGDALLITGSFFVVGEALEEFA